MANDETTPAEPLVIAGSENRTAQINGINLFYRIAGQSEPVLLWHGFLETSYCWRKIVPLLAPHYTVIVPDMRGYGDSDKPEGGYDARTLKDDFRLLVQSLGFGTASNPIHLVAHDMGAPPALLYAGEHPDEVRSLTYLDEPVLTRAAMQPLHAFTPEGTKNGGLWWWPFALAGDMPERLIVGNERAFLEWFYENYTLTKGAMEPEVVDEYLRSFAGKTGVRGAFGVYRAIFDSIAQTEPYLQNKITVPVLGLGGEGSIGDRTRQMLTTVAANVQGGAMPDCGHFLADEQPAALVARLQVFFASGSGA